MDIVNRLIEQIRNVASFFTKSSSAKFGEQSYVWTKSFTVTNNSTKEENVQVPSYDLLITNISIYYTHGNDIYNGLSTSGRDQVNLQIKHDDVDVFGGQSMDALEYSNIASSNVFQPFVLPAKTLLDFSLTHVQNNHTTGDLTVYVSFFGKKINKEDYKVIG